MHNYTVMGFYEESQQIFSHHVAAEDSSEAFAVVSQSHADAVFVAVLDGHLKEGKGIEFPGSALVDAETVIAQPNVFGLGNPKPFSELSAIDLAEWISYACSVAEDRNAPIGECDDEEAQEQARHHYDELKGVLPSAPKVPIQKLADDMSEALNKTTAQLSGKVKTVTVTLAALTRVDYSEDVVVPVEFDESLLERLTESAYDNVDGGEYCEGPDYWEKGGCYHTES